MSENKGTFSHWREGLNKAHQNLWGRIETLLAGKPQIEPGDWQALEEILLLSDLGPQTARAVLETAHQQLTPQHQNLKASLSSILLQTLLKVESKMEAGTPRPFVILALGVNGAGKTTTIGKLAWRWQQEGKKVMLAAADTFRAAAIEQLEIWAGRTGAALIKQQTAADPSAVAFDAVKAAQSRDMDILIIDTAGRLHTKGNLMEELKKVKRVVDKAYPGAPHEVLLVLDATTGQNALNQAREFHLALGVTAIALVKMDGSAKGGIIVRIAEELGIPIKLIGLGEKPEDLVDFSARAYVEGLLG